jgi:lipase chaperone LimK
MKPIMGLGEQPRVRSIRDLIGYFFSPVGWQAVQNDHILIGTLNQCLVNLVGREDL